MRHMTRLRLFLFLAPVLALLTTAPLVYASDQVVNNCTNDVELRADLTTMQSTNGGTLTFNCQTTITISSQLPDITTNTTIDGGNKVILTGLSAVRLFEVKNTGFLHLKNIVLERGYGGGGRRSRSCGRNQPAAAKAANNSGRTPRSTIGGPGARAITPSSPSSIGSAATTTGS